MSELYPLRFKPLPREMIWGGNNLNKKFNKDFPSGVKIGESWEISGITGNISVVDNGYLKGNNLEELIEVYMGDLVGEKVFKRFGLEFPLLIKFIDACETLSVQVHPDDEVAARHNAARGKTEMWYVLEAEPGSELISGFKGEVTSGLFLEKLESGKLMEILNTEKVTEGDVFFIPAGRVHAIGGGIILAEIQQSSDSTYRIYDWDRPGPDGKQRELHIEKALEAIDFQAGKAHRARPGIKDNTPVTLADCEYFTTNLLQVKGTVERDYSLPDSFIIYICTNGEFLLEWANGKMTVKKGDTVMIPAAMTKTVISCSKKSVLLEVYIK
jgi:mannose-6-phosphate isomerase